MTATDVILPGHPGVFSPCRDYRYTLWREWLYGEGYLMVIGLNPSVADLQRDDNTLKKCMGYAARWGYRALCMTNLFGYRATDPDVMKGQFDPVGIENNRWLTEVAEHANMILIAWGKHGSHMNRAEQVMEVILKPYPLYRIGVNKDGSPEHPLYIKKTAKPELIEKL